MFFSGTLLVVHHCISLECVCLVDVEHGNNLGWLNNVKQIRSDFLLNTDKHGFKKLGEAVNQIRNDG